MHGIICLLVVYGPLIIIRQNVPISVQYILELPLIRLSSLPPAPPTPFLFNYNFLT